MKLTFHSNRWRTCGDRSLSQKSASPDCGKARLNCAAAVSWRQLYLKIIVGIKSRICWPVGDLFSGRPRLTYVRFQEVINIQGTVKWKHCDDFIHLHKDATLALEKPIDQHKMTHSSPQKITLFICERCYLFGNKTFGVVNIQIRIWMSVVWQDLLVTIYLKVRLALVWPLWKWNICCCANQDRNADQRGVNDGVTVSQGEISLQGKSFVLATWSPRYMVAYSPEQLLRIGRVFPRKTVLASISPLTCEVGARLAGMISVEGSFQRLINGITSARRCSHQETPANHAASSALAGGGCWGSGSEVKVVRLWRQFHPDNGIWQPFYDAEQSPQNGIMFLIGFLHFTP